MKYLHRFDEKKVLDCMNWFKVVLVTGARQVGKTTLLKNLYPNLKVITFDPIQDLYGVRKDPDLFLDSFPGPIILDEVQYVPELFPALKRRVDRSEKKGQYLLTGSQNPLLMKQIADSMAGRVGVVELDGMAIDEWCERADAPTWVDVWLDSKGTAAPEDFTVLESQRGLLASIWRGDLPGLCEMPDEGVSAYLDSYFKTYIERDVRMSGNVREIQTFASFVALCAALTGQEKNKRQFGRELGLSPASAEAWAGILSSTFQWRELIAYSRNLVKKVAGKPKGYMCDTGLACYLQRLSSPEALAASPVRGAFFETWALNTIRKQASRRRLPPEFSYWRLLSGAEVDGVLEEDGRRYLVECKCTTTLSAHDLRGINSFRRDYGEKAPAVVFYAGDVCRRLDDLTLAMPWKACARA